MTDIECSQCGALVRVAGLAATCPHCGNLVIAGELPPPTIVEPAREPVEVPRYDPIPDFNPNDVEPVDSLPPQPAPLPVQPVEEPLQSKLTIPWKYIGYGALALLAFALLIDWVRLRAIDAAKQRSAANSTPTIVQRPRPQPAPEPSIFSEATTVPSPAPATTLPHNLEPQPEPAPKQSYPFVALAAVRPVPPEHPPDNVLTDEQVGESIRKGVEWLIDDFSGSRLRGDSSDAEVFAGRNALAAYALLHAGPAINDPRLLPKTDFIKGLLDRLKEYPMNGNKAVYSRALRLSALGIYARPEDRSQIEKDAAYLMEASVNGGFDYQTVPKDQRANNPRWDNSNSQYGVLGLWAAAEAGFRVKNIFWSDVEGHWTDSQAHNGAWGYQRGDENGNLALTAGGITSLFVARDQLLANGSELDPNAAAPRAIKRGIEWLDDGDHAVELPGNHPGYSLYGLERAGLASGYKFFGSHDWYLELAKKVIASQQKDGSWTGGDGTDVETSFVLLFLSRGRHPVLISKLEFDGNGGGNWANYARDIANLTRYAGKQLERPLNWQVVNLNRSWGEWTDTNVLYLATDKPPELNDATVEKLRAFCEAGGLLFTHADHDSAESNAFAIDLAKRMFPDYPFQKVPENHPLYSSVFPLHENPPPMMGVSNGARLLMVHSPTDLARVWQRRNERAGEMQFKMGVNVAIYASGRRELRNRVESLFVAEPTESPIATIPIARLRFNGNWDPEPGAWRRFARSFENASRIHLNIMPVSPADLRLETAPLAVLTGVGAFTPSPEDIAAMRNYVSKGGVLMIDSCGGRPEFADAARQMITRLSPSASPTPISGDHALLQGGERGMEKVAPLRARPFTTEMLAGKPTPAMLTLKLGDGEIIFSQLDLTSGLLGTATWGIAGYQPSTSQSFMKNLVLWSCRIPPR